MSARKKIRLQDLAPRKVYAELSVGDLQVTHLGAGEIAGLFLRFPALSALADGENVSKNAVSVLAESAPEAVPAVIALGAGMPGKRGVEYAKALSAADQLKALAKIIEVTFPEGLEGFLAEVEGLAGKAEALAPALKEDETADVVERPD